MAIMLWPCSAALHGYALDLLVVCGVASPMGCYAVSFNLYLHQLKKQSVCLAGAASPPYNQMQDSPPFGPHYQNGMPPGGPPGQDRTAGFPPGQHQMPPQGFIPPEASGGMPNYMGGGFRPPGMPPHLRLPPPGPLPGNPQNKRPGKQFLHLSCGA